MYVVNYSFQLIKQEKFSDGHELREPAIIQRFLFQWDFLLAGSILLQATVFAIYFTQSQSQKMAFEIERKINDPRSFEILNIH